MRPSAGWCVLLGIVLACSGCRLHDAPPQSRVVLEDGHDDLWNDDEDQREPVVANADAVRSVIRRTRDALVVTVRYRDIERRASPDWGVEFEFDIGDHTTRGVTWFEYRFSGTHRWDRDLDMTRYDSEDALSAVCHRLRAVPDFSAETVTIRVPEGCFRHAKWVVVQDVVAVSRTPGRHGDRTRDPLGTSGHEPVHTPRLVRPTSSARPLA
jgi:hypothetical protein